MAGMSSDMERHAEEPTTRPVKKNQEGENIERQMNVDQVTDVPFWGTISEFAQLQLHRRREEKEERMRNSQNPSGIYQIGGESPELLAGNEWKMHKNTEASVAEAGGPEESVKPGEAEGKQRDLIDSQEKLAKKKAKDEEAGEASVREAGKAEAYVIEAGKAVADMMGGGRSLPDSQEQLANKNEKKNRRKNRKKNQKNKAKAEANLKEEETGKAEASVTEAEKPEESVTQSGKAEASVTDEETDEEKSVVFEDAEYFGARFQSFWDKCFGYRCAYDETTTIPAMCYTHGSDAFVCTRDTLQVVSVKVVSIEEGLSWPLHVFGMVSVRDVVDRKRNIIFHRERDNCQIITKKDPYLTLTGPSRAVVVCADPSYIEVVLKVKGPTESEDKELSRLAAVYRHSCLINGLYPCELSTLKLRFSQVYGSVEATIHIKVTGGSWPDGFKGVFGAATARTKCAKVKLLSVGEDGLPVDAVDGGMIRLSRRVVSVELSGMLKLFVSACSAGGDEEERCEVSFVPQKDGVSPGVELKIGSCGMEATVAWSLFCGIY